MPDPKKKKDEAPKTAEGPKKKGRLKSVVIFAAVLLLEAAAITVVFVFAGRPSDVRGDSVAEKLARAAEKPTEVLVVSDRFQNTATGRAYLYETEIYIVVKKKHEDLVKTRIKDMEAQIATDISQIIRRAEPSHLLEPTLSTLTRQVRHAIDQRLGKDEESIALVEEALITKCHQYRSDL
jgi:flagellar basal body-associated protein FliL